MMSGLAGNTLDGKVDIQSFKQQREIRVFISSTFKDMVKERDELIKYTFPRLRKMCEERGISWSEVDLRWGVTSEQSAEGKVLPICLKEIKNCLPFFIGILGERYGWIPEITHELIQEYPWLEKYVGKSVTELEILQGALLYNNEEENINAFFYFRDPEYIHSVSEEEKNNFIEMIDEEELKHISPNEDIQQLVEDRTGKLAHLKDQIRESQYHVREDFSDAKELGEMVYSDLSKLINEIFPKDVPEDELERRAIEQETFAFMKSKVFRGRENYLEEMTKHIDNDNPVPLVITGESGAGKSALLSKWFLNIQPNLKAQKIPYIIHFIGAGSRDGDVSDSTKKNDYGVK